MEENTITLTEAELNAKIEEAVNSKTKDLVSKHNGEMASARKRIKELENSNLSQEEIEARVRKEQDEATQNELAELRSYKKGKVIEERLSKEGLPSYFKNDSRLLNAKDEDFDKAIKDVKKEYEATLPKGNTHSTVVQTYTNGANQEKDATSKANEEMGNALKQIIG
jgi:hypothetical protein